MADISETTTASRKLTRAERKELKAQRKAVKKANRKGLLQRISNAVGGSDIYVLGMVLALSIFGIAMVFSAGYYQTINVSHPNPFFYLYRQGFFVLTGLVLMAMLANFDYHYYGWVH